MKKTACNLTAMLLLILFVGGGFPEFALAENDTAINYFTAGTVSLQNGEKAPATGIEVEVAIYIINSRGQISPSPLKSSKVLIKAGESSTTYRLNYSAQWHDWLLLKYAIAGHTPYMEGTIRDDLKNKDNINVMISRSVHIEGQVIFPDYAMSIKHAKNGLVSINTPDGSRINRQYIQLKDQQNSINFNIAIPRSSTCSDYVVKCEIANYGTIPPDDGSLWIGPLYYAYVSSLPIQVKDKDITGINFYVSIPIDTYLHGLKISSLNLDGNIAVAVSDLDKYGFEVKWNPNRTINISSSNKPCIGYGNRIAYENWQPVKATTTDIIVFMAGKTIPCYFAEGKIVIKVKDLKQTGLNVQFDQSKNEVRID